MICPLVRSTLGPFETISGNFTLRGARTLAFEECHVHAQDDELANRSALGGRLRLEFPVQGVGDVNRPRNGLLFHSSIIVRVPQMWNIGSSSPRNWQLQLEVAFWKPLKIHGCFAKVRGS